MKTAIINTTLVMTDHLIPGATLVMEDGKVTGAGTHEQLLETCPLYKEISDSQMGGALLE